MGRIGLALRVLFNGQFAGDVAKLAASSGPPAIEQKPSAPAAPKAPPPPARSQALTLLETLQREARFVDFIKEPIDGYSDAQVGAAVRNIHRDCGTVLERLFAIRPLLDNVEGSVVDVSDSEAGRVRLTGNVSGGKVSRGKLAHHGWHALRCEVPAWTGNTSSEPVIAPAEVEV